MTSKKKKKILVIDDSKSVRDFFLTIFSNRQDYEITSASNGYEAVDIIKRTISAPQSEIAGFDFVLSDINMQGIDGFETLEQIRELVPNVKTGMITGFNVDDYIDMALQKGVYNIICKNDAPQEIVKTIETLISGEKIFGINNYMLSDIDEITSVQVKNTLQLKIIAESIISYMEELLDEDKQYGIKTGLIEIGTNAIYHAHGYEKGSEVTLGAVEKVMIEYTKDCEKLAVGIVDTSGRLTKEKVLLHLDKSINPTQEDILKSGGRGLFLTRMFCDRMIVNIEKNRRTEILLFMYFKKQKVNKPLLINQI